MAKKKNKKKIKKKTAKKKNTGVSLELAVARIQEMLDPNSKVTHNETLKDRVGNDRQFDVVIRGTFGGQPALGVAECKDHDTKKGPAEVEAFAKKTENLRANLRIMVSRLGFTDQAIRLAKHEGITCLSLIPADPTQTGIDVTSAWYAQLWNWDVDSLKLTMYFPGSAPALPPYDAGDVLYENKSVLHWFLQQLATTHAEHYSEDPLELIVKFAESRILTIHGTPYEVAGLSFRAQRVCTHKRKFVPLYGDAVYDWQTKKCTLPLGGHIRSSMIDGSFEDFEEFNGKKTDGPELVMELTIVSHKEQFTLPPDVADLTKL